MTKRPRAKKSPMMRKVILVVVDAKGNEAPQWAIDEMIEEQEFSDLGRSLPETLELRARERINYLDYRAIIMTVLQRPKSSEGQGGNYAEMKQVEELLDILSDAEGEHHFLCTEVQFQDLVERCKKFKWAQLSIQIREFIDSVIDSEKMEVQAVASEDSDAA